MNHLLWLIPALPLAGFLALVVGGRVLGEPRSGWLATAAGGVLVLDQVETLPAGSSELSWTAIAKSGVMRAPAPRRGRIEAKHVGHSAAAPSQCRARL